MATDSVGEVVLRPGLKSPVAVGLGQVDSLPAGACTITANGAEFAARNRTPCACADAGRSGVCRRHCVRVIRKVRAKDLAAAVRPAAARYAHSAAKPPCPKLKRAV